jgi:hypothetical protein
VTRPELRNRLNLAAVRPGESTYDPNPNEDKKEDMDKAKIKRKIGSVFQPGTKATRGEQEDV